MFIIEERMGIINQLIESGNPPYLCPRDVIDKFDIVDNLVNFYKVERVSVKNKMSQILKEKINKAGWDLFELSHNYQLS